MIFSTSDSTKTMSITTSGILNVDSQIMLDTDSALSAFNATDPISTVTYSSNVAVITLKDARQITFTISLGGNPPATVTSNLVSSNYWSRNEYTSLQALSSLLLTLELQYAVTNISITYN
jgi:hypothetical protein